MNKYGKLYLIPTPLGDYPPEQVLPPAVLSQVCALRNFVVEEVRSARRFLSAAGLRGHIGELSFRELNEHTPPEAVEGFLSLFESGSDVGLLSEAGLPAVADPGALLVDLCHRHDIEVVPLTGPSSLMLALMGSGLNGQQFAFCGYLPAKTEERRRALREIEKRSRAARQTQLFIETPYRNDALLADILATCQGTARLTLAVNLTLPDGFVRTRTVARWRKDVPVIGKRPCVFLLLG